MKKEDQELLKKCEGAFAIASSMLHDPEINNMLDLFQRFKQLASTQAESKPEINLNLVEKLVLITSNVDCEESSLNPSAKQDAENLRQRIGYSLADLPKLTEEGE